MSNKKNITLDGLTGLCKRRGFIFQASEIYGGLNGFWDYGPLGVALKNNLRDRWWRDMVQRPPIGPDGERISIVGLDSSIIQNPKTWEASGHVAGFSDPMVDCKTTKHRYRADHLRVQQVTLQNKDNEAIWEGYLSAMEGDLFNDVIQQKLKKVLKKMGATAAKFPEEDTSYSYTELDEESRKKVIGPDTFEVGTLTEPKEFNLMFRTFIGATSGEENVAYLRPETAQGIFLNYKNVLDTMRVNVPFGIAQIGKAFRNEVTPRNFIFRSREFEQMEMEWFCHPDEAEKWYAFWVEQRHQWWASLGIEPSRLITREHGKDELAHYSTACADVEYQYPFTYPDYGELEGIAHRGNFDLTQHQQHSNVKMEFFDQQRGEKYIPHVIEPASGLTRGVLVLLCEAYAEEWVPKKADDGHIQPAIPGEPVPEGYELRSVMKFAPSLAPIQVAVFPLLKNRPELVAKARDVYEQVSESFVTDWDVSGAIGRRYRRQDEIGTPYCVTVDFDSLENHTVTVRDRDTMQQEHIKIDALNTYLFEKINR